MIVNHTLADLLTKVEFTQLIVTSFDMLVLVSLNALFYTKKKKKLVLTMTPLIFLN